MALITLTLRLQRNKPFLDQIGSFRIMVAVKPPQSLRWCQMTIMASRITGQSSVCSTVTSHWQQKRNIKGPCYSPFVRGIHQWPVDSPHKSTVTRKMLPFDYVTIGCWWTRAELAPRHPESSGSADLIDTEMVHTWERYCCNLSRILLFFPNYIITFTNKIRIKENINENTWTAPRLESFSTVDGPHHRKVSANLNNSLRITVPSGREIKFRFHDDVIKWKRFRHYMPFATGIRRLSMNFPHKGQWGEALMLNFYLT